MYCTENVDQIEEFTTQELKHVHVVCPQGPQEVIHDKRPVNVSLIIQIKEYYNFINNKNVL